MGGWIWVCCSDFHCGHTRALPFAPWAIRWGTAKPDGLIKRNFVCSRCGKSARLTTPSWGGKQIGNSPFPKDPLRIGGQRRTGENCAETTRRNIAEYLSQWPNGDAILAFERTDMCNLYSLTSNQQAIRDLVKLVRDLTGNLPPLPAIFPDQLAPIVRAGPDGAREMRMMRWGFPHEEPKPGEKKRSGYVTNVRHAKSRYWEPWLHRDQRCLVPVTSFSEYDHRTAPPTCTWFAQNETRPLFFFAGIWRPWTGTRGTKANPAEGEHLLFSFLTTFPNKIVAPVHPKAMPVLLLNEEAREIWMNGTVDEALALQKSAPDDALQIVLRGKKEDMGTTA